MVCPIGDNKLSPYCEDKGGVVREFSDGCGYFNSSSSCVQFMGDHELVNAGNC